MGGLDPNSGSCSCQHPSMVHRYFPGQHSYLGPWCCRRILVDPSGLVVAEADIAIRFLPRRAWVRHLSMATPHPLPFVASTTHPLRILLMLARLGLHFELVE